MNMPKQFTLFLLTIFVSFHYHAQRLSEEYQVLMDGIRQGNYSDSADVFKKGGEAIKIAHKLKDNSKKALVYQYFGNFNYYSGKLQDANRYYDTSILIAALVPDSNIIVSSLVRKTFIQAIDDAYNAEPLFKRLSQIAERNNFTTSLVECYNGLGIIYEDRQDHPTALEYYIKALKEASKEKDPRLMGMLYNNIGLIKLYQDQFDEALEDFQEGLKYADLSDDIRLPFNLLNNIGLIYTRQEQNDLALDHYLTTLQRAKKLGFPYYIAVTFINLSNVYLQLEKFDPSLAYADSAKTILYELNDLKNISKAYYVKSSVYLKQKNFKQALIEITKGLEYSDSEQRLEDQASGNKLKASIYEAMGDYKLAYEHFKIFHQLSDSLASLTNTEKFRELQMAFDKERSDAELEQERANRLMLEKESELRESRLVIVIVSLIFLGIAIGVFFYLQHIRSSRQQQRQFTQKLIDNVDEERSRISRDLHDDIGQSLSVIKSRLNQYAKGNPTAIEGLDEEIGNIINQTRSISHSLHPSLLEKIGAKRSIISILDKLESTTGLITSYEIDDSIDVLSNETQTQLYRIIQECINNTLKHADAKSIRVMLQRENGEWLFSYQDNGKGFDSNSVEGQGLGMQTIKERALKIGAKPQIQSQPNKGIKITFRFN
jgi:two-component system, NarL family, sensor kinase